MSTNDNTTTSHGASQMSKPTYKTIAGVTLKLNYSGTYAAVLGCCLDAAARSAADTLRADAVNVTTIDGYLVAFAAR